MDERTADGAWKEISDTSIMKNEFDNHLFLRLVDPWFLIFAIDPMLSAAIIEKITSKVACR
jgi:hypothetical protein